MSRPVVIVAADATAGAAFSTEDAERLARRQPGVEVIRIAGSGHRIHDEHSIGAAFAEHLHRFLDVYAS